MKLNVNFRPEGVAGGLCGRCEESTVMTDERGREVVYCHYFHPTKRIQMRVKECTDYTARGALSYHEMKNTAWVLEVKKGKPVGFRPPKQED